jgi:hypothetical protein
MKYIQWWSKLNMKHTSWVSYLEQFNYTLKHKARIHYIVVDVLSCRASLLSTMRVEIKGFDTYKEFYQEDSSFGPILKQTMVEGQAGYTLQSGFLFKENQLCILECSLREKIVKELHEEGHFGCDKTMALIS